MRKAQKIMINVIGVRFKPVGKTYYFSPANLNIKQGDHVIVETSRGVEYGEVVMGQRSIETEQFRKPVKDVLRLATPEDHARYKHNREFEKEAYDGTMYHPFGDNFYDAI